MLTQIDQLPTETFVARLVGMYHHWLSLCLRRREVCRRAEPAVGAHNAIIAIIAVADAVDSPVAEHDSALWDHTTTQRMHTWTPNRPALQQGAAGHLTHPGGSAPRLGLSAQAPAHLHEHC